MFKKYKFLFLLILTSALAVLSIHCTESSTSFYIDSRETLKKEKIASFYGLQARKNCENFRRLYTGFCDSTSQPFITCYDLNDKKFKLSSCE